MKNLFNATSYSMRNAVFLTSFVGLTSAFASPAFANSSFTITGNLSNPNEMVLFDMAFPTGSTAGSIYATDVGYFAVTGIDPLLTLFAANGTSILAQDDDSGDGLDAVISGDLPIGSYILALTAYNFFPSDINDASGITNGGYTLFNSLNWSVTFTGPENAIISQRATTVPVPAAVWLFGTALAGFVGFKRKY